MMAIEYPKEHDVGDLFAETCIARNLDIELAELDAIRAISARLVRERQPSFYMEQQYTDADAMRAREGAHKVLMLVGQLVERMRGGRL